jgi:hypothetical protein
MRTGIRSGVRARNVVRRTKRKANLIFTVGLVRGELLHQESVVVLVRLTGKLYQNKDRGVRSVNRGRS